MQKPFLNSDEGDVELVAWGRNPERKLLIAIACRALNDLSVSSDVRLIEQAFFWFFELRHFYHKRKNSFSFAFIAEEFAWDEKRILFMALGRYLYSIERLERAYVPPMELIRRLRGNLEEVGGRHSWVRGHRLQVAALECRRREIALLPPGSKVALAQAGLIVLRDEETGQPSRRGSRTDLARKAPLEAENSQESERELERA